MSVEMTPCHVPPPHRHLNHLISSTPALGMGGAERLRRPAATGMGDGSGRDRGLGRRRARLPGNHDIRTPRPRTGVAVR